MLKVISRRVEFGGNVYRVGELLPDGVSPSYSKWLITQGYCVRTPERRKAKNECVQGEPSERSTDDIL